MAVSELPGYPGRRRVLQSLPHEAIKSTDQNFTPGNAGVCLVSSPDQIFRVRLADSLKNRPQGAGEKFGVCGRDPVARGCAWSGTANGSAHHSPSPPGSGTNTIIHT